MSSPRARDLRAGWLVTALHQACAEPTIPLPALALGDEAARRRWLDQWLHAHRAGALLPEGRGRSQGTPEADRRSLLWAHGELVAALLCRVLGAAGGAPTAGGARGENPTDAARTGAWLPEAALVLAAATGDDRGLERLLEATDGGGAEAGGEPAKRDLESLVEATLSGAERALEAQQLPAGHPLWGSPVHRLVLRGDAALVGTLALDRAAGRLAGPGAAELADRRRAQAALARQAFVEAAVGMAYADRHLARSERRLLRRLAEVARLPEDELAVILDLAGASTPAPSEFAARLACGGEREAALAMVLEMGLVDGALGAGERRYCARVADALELDTATRLAVHARVAGVLAADARATSRWSPSALADRVQLLATRDLRRVVERNATAIVRELEQTGDLVQLLARSTTEDLTPEEHQRMHAQLLDLARAVPALAILAAPGGSLLLPLLVRLLPVDLTLSAWRRDEPGASGDGASASPRPPGGPGTPDAEPDAEPGAEPDAE